MTTDTLTRPWILIEKFFSIDDLEIVQYKTRFPVYTQMCRNLKEKAPSGSLLGDFDSRIKLNTFIETNVRVLPDVYLSL